MTHAPLAVAALTLLCSSCASDRPGWVPFVRADVAVYDDYESDIELTGFSSNSTSADYDAFRIAAGAADVRTGRPALRLEAFIGRATFEGRSGLDDIDIDELGVGARWFVPIDDRTVHPFLSLHGIASLGNATAGVDPGNQVAVAIGAGVEFAVAEGVALDLALDHTLPFIDAESDPAGLEVGTGGFAVRLGVVLTPWAY